MFYTQHPIKIKFLFTSTAYDPQAATLSSAFLMPHLTAGLCTGDHHAGWRGKLVYKDSLVVVGMEFQHSKTSLFDVKKLF